MAKVLVTGGTGLVGKHLCRRLLEDGYEVVNLSRRKSPGNEIPSYLWDLEKRTIDPEAVLSADYIVHLAGTNIGGKRWTNKRRQQILDSRVASGEIIYHQVKTQNKQPMAYITASAVGYYGAVSAAEPFEETSAPSDDFLGRTCSAWEHVADKFSDLGVRSVKIRTGIVLSKDGGALSKLSLPVRLGLGAALGDGNQYLPWIHIDDLCSIYLQAIENTNMHGPYNAVAPEQVTNKEFTRKMARIIKKPLWLPNIPTTALRLILGDMSQMLVYGSKISSEKIVSSGYQFQYPDLGSALENCLMNEKKAT
ncbi:MAG: TIGR01777 family oxidoreductase [Bacteroidota bacterium]